MNRTSGPFSFTIKTLGCKANLYDSLVLENQLLELGGVRDDVRPSLFVLNTCTVTDGADKQCKYEVSRLKKNAPEAKVLVTGCYTQVAEEKVKAISGVDYVVNNENKGRLKTIVAQEFDIQSPDLLAPENDSDIYWGQLPLQSDKTRAFVKIQDGCNDFCTYCIIPYARGKSRSMKMGMILSEITRLVEQGVHEVVLTGINIADYGHDHGYVLEDLIEAILEFTKLPRLRLTSLDPSEITDRILKLMHPGSRLMPHVHVSLQSANDRVLRAMKRKYKASDIVDALDRIHAANPEIFVGMDMITGFPSETLEEHESSMELLKQLQWNRLHVFPYSEREGTPALKLKPAVTVQERRRRANEMIELSMQRHKEFVNRYVGKTVDEVLFEAPHEAGGDWFLPGHTKNYVRVLARIPERTLEEANKLRNTTGSVRVVGLSPVPAQDWTMEGVVCRT